MRRLILALLVGILLCGLAIAPVAAQQIWPGAVLLWRGTETVTQTVQYRTVDMIGADSAMLFYNTGYGSVTGTVFITVTRQWMGLTFGTVATSTVVDDLVAGTGALTVATAHPYWPSAQVAVVVSAGTITPVVAMVGQ